MRSQGRPGASKSKVADQSTLQDGQQVTYSHKKLCAA
jgi:hypothetical protein